MKFLFIACGLWLALKSTAQEADTIQLREVLISARIIPSDSLPQPTLHPPVQVMDLLERIPGVVRAQASSFPISYRGQTGSRLRIQQNGARRSGLNPQGYLGQDLSTSNLSKAQIVDGIEKAIYGSGAIGGVLVLEDQQAFVKSPTTIYSQFRTNSNARQLGFRWNNGNEPTRLAFAGSGIATNDFHFPNRQTALNSAIREYNLSTALTTQLKKRQINWRQKWSSGNWQFPQGFQNNPFELRELDNAYTYQSDLKFKHQLRSGWDLTHQAWGLALETDQTQDQYNAQFEMINFQIVRNYRRLGFGYNGYAEKTLAQFTIKSGLDLFSSRLNEKRFEDDRVRNSTTRTTVAKRDDRQAGLFVSARTLGKKVKWKGVLRADLASNAHFDTQSQQTSALSGGAEAQWRWLRADHQISIGRYFRFPRPEEAGGELFGGRGVFRGNPDIRPEYSYQLEWKVAKTTKSTSFSISSWLAYFENRIIEVPVAQGIFQYDNIDQARTFGLEWQLSQMLINQNKHNLVGHFSGLIMQGDDLTEVSFFAKGSRSNGIPPAHLRAEIRYKTWFGNLPFQLSFDGQHFSKFIAPTGFTNQVWAVRDAPAYTLLGAQANTRIQWGQNALLISAGISNLTDEAYFPFGTRVMGMGRDFRFGLNYSF